MRSYWLRKEGHPALCVMVLGWGVDHKVLGHLEFPERSDVLCLYDFRDLNDPDNIIPAIASYTQQNLYAWSFGVRVCEHLFVGSEFHTAIAFNGTPFPVDDLHGIERRRMDVTLRGLSSAGRELFRERTYGASYEQFRDRVEARSLGEDIEELKSLIELSASDIQPSINWTSAIVGTDDVIFPPRNMIRYWSDLAVCMPLPHFPFADPKILTKCDQNQIKY